MRLEMQRLQVGMTVIVDITGYSKAGVALGKARASGTIVALGHEGVTVQLDATFAGVNVLTTPHERVLLAQ